MLFCGAEDSPSTERDTLTRPSVSDTELDTDPLSHARMQKNTNVIRQMIALMLLNFAFNLYFLLFLSYYIFPSQFPPFRDAQPGASEWWDTI